jgi:type IV secretion system VirB5/TraC/TraE/TrbJ family protein
MRALLLGGVAALLLLPVGARAQLVVDAPVQDMQGLQSLINDSTELANWVTQLKSWETELADWSRQYGQMAQQITQLVTIGNAVSHVTDIGGAVSALGLVGIQNPLPVNPWAVQSLLAGTNTGLAGIGGTIGGLVNRSWDANHFYTPVDGSLASQLLIERANGQAGYQGVAGGLYQAISDRMPLLRDLHDRLVSSTDVKESADLQARYTIELNYVQAQATQFNAVKAMAEAQQHAWDTRRDEQLSKSLADMIGAADAHGY